MRSIKKSIVALTLALAMAFSVPAQSYAAKAITTPVKSLPARTDVKNIRVSVNSDNGKKRSYNIFAQRSGDRRNYVSIHGCAVCSLTTVLSGYAPKYKNYTPQKTYQVLEKKVFGRTAWNNNYRKSLNSQMPVSLYGITRVLNYAGVNTKYVRNFKDKQAINEIKAHLKTGNAVMVELNNHTQKNGRFSSRYTSRWALSKHTVTLIGMTNTGKVIIADSAQRNWSGKHQRVKYASMEELVKYMIPSHKKSNSFYFRSTAVSGGYILVNYKK